MKKILCYLSLVAVPALAQTPSLQWERSVNGQLSGYENTQYAWQEPSGNFLIVGTSEYDAFVQKVDNQGNQLLRVKWDSPQRSTDIGMTGRSDAAGNIYVGGLTIYGSMYVPFMAKYDASGVKQWEYLQTNVAVTGTITAMTLDSYTNPTSVYFTGSKNDSSAITKLNAATGAPVWEKTLWPHGQMNDIDIDNNGHPLVCGYQASSGLNADFFAGVLDITTGYPLRGYWRDGAATDSVTNPNSYFDQAYKIKAGPSGTFIVLGVIYDSPGVGTVYMTKFGSIGNTPAWTYSYNSPNHSSATGVRLLTDAAFSNFYYLAGAISTTGAYYKYDIVGKVNNTGTAVWEKEYYIGATSLQANDMALDANGNVHFISDSGYPGDVYYKKLASSNGSLLAQLQYDNMRGGGGAYDVSTNIYLDNTGHPYVFGSSSVLNFTNNDILMFRLNTNATLDWDLTIDFYVHAPNYAFNVLTALNPGDGHDQIISCGMVINNITSADVAITSYSESGNINWQALFDDNNGGDQVVGFEKSTSYNDLFLCSFNNSTSQTSITQFYSDGTTNFSYKPGWAFTPNSFKIDSAENAFVAGAAGSTSDFDLGIYLRNSGTAIECTRTPGASMSTVPYSIATDNTYGYVAGTYDIYGPPYVRYLYIQSYDLLANRQWSAKIPGLDSTNNPAMGKIVYNRATNSIYLIGQNTPVGSGVVQMVIARINANGTVAWVRKENMADTRNEYPQNLTVANGMVYVTGYATGTANPNDHMMLTEAWDVNGNKQWEYVYDKVGTMEEGASVVVNSAGDIFVGGKTNDDFYVQGRSDLLLVKLNPAGNLIWKQEQDGPGQGIDFCTNIALSSANTTNPRIYMCANTQAISGGNYDIGTFKYCDLPPATISYSGPTSICQNSSITLAAAGITGGGTVTWSPGGSASQAIVAGNSGNYYFSYSEPDGCMENSDTVAIHIKGAPAPVQICMVTVDDSSKHNLILWDKTMATPDVIGFNVYREDLTNVYHQIGSVPYASLSEYVDLDGNANPNTTTKRYKLTTVDSCGNESQMSNYHNTIYIVSNGNGQFSWNQLYTIENSPNPVVQYMLLRDDYNTNNWHVIDSTAGTQFNINDVNFNNFQPTASWRVATQWNISCTPTARLAGGNSVQAAVVKSKSNITNNRTMSVGTLNDKNVRAYPNPAQNSLTVAVPNGNNTSVKLISLVGQEVYKGIMPGDTQKIDLSNLAAGTYLLEVKNDAGQYISRIVKE